MTQKSNMPDPKSGFDILIILMDEDTPRNPFELLSLDDNVCECGASGLVPSYLAMPSLKAAILAVLELFPLEACPMEKTVISVTGRMHYILN